MNNYPLNLNIQDDISLNDYLYCWNFLGKKPSKISFYFKYTNENFTKIISSHTIKKHGTISDIISVNDAIQINRRNLIQINEGFFISYLELGSSNIIADVCIYYLDSEYPEELVKKLSEENIKNEEKSNESNLINIIQIGQNGLTLLQTDLIEIDTKKLHLYYNNSTWDEVKSLIKDIDESYFGISVIYGERGTGKTYLSNYIAGESERPVIFIPLNSADLVINSPEFLPFLMDNPNSLLIIDDIECIFNDVYKRPDFFINNLLQLIDGQHSHTIDIQILLILNVGDQENIPEEILNSNNLIKLIKIDELDLDSSKKLCKHLKIKNSTKSPSKLINILKGKNSEIYKNIGY